MTSLCWLVKSKLLWNTVNLTILLVALLDTRQDYKHLSEYPLLNDYNHIVSVFLKTIVEAGLHKPMKGVYSPSPLTLDFSPTLLKRLTDQKCDFDFHPPESQDNMKDLFSF